MPVPISNKVDLAPRRLLRDTVAESIRSAILDGSFRPGERLHDEELQGWLGVSRTPIRDALNELSRAGLVEMAPNRLHPGRRPGLPRCRRLARDAGGAAFRSAPHRCAADDSLRAPRMLNRNGPHPAGVRRERFGGARCVSQGRWSIC
ncbi:GntR family transcriptional regulator [Leifsonia xyli]|uniref:GntR family transcriptional regulator n=1 Tax=Leifsonia xyli TaxID=1575 RepID=UPI0009DB76CD|nr:GntR family transcriptional regulator [Leifsonia xyli]